MRYFKECKKEEAEFKRASFVSNFGPQIVGIKPTPKSKKIIDLESMAGNDQILFEFSDDCKTWVEGYFRSKGSGEFLYRCGRKWDGCLGGRTMFKYIRFQSDRWYPWNGDKCPLPDGLWVKFRFRGMSGDINHATFYPWEHTGGMSDIIAFRILGPVDGWRMPGDE